MRKWKIEDPHVRSKRCKIKFWADHDCKHSYNISYAIHVVYISLLILCACKPSLSSFDSFDLPRIGLRSLDKTKITRGGSKIFICIYL